MGEQGGVGSGTESILVTGISGFVGSHLADYILGLGLDLNLHGLFNSNGSNIDHLLQNPRLFLHQVDVLDKAALAELIDRLRPSRIYHLAGQSFVGAAIGDPVATLHTNCVGTINLLEAVRRAGLEKTTRILNIGSGDEYGFVRPDELPVKESNPFRPGNPYAVSKISQELFGYQYFRSYGLQVVAIRPFNHLGPRQSDRFASAAFAHQIALAEAGQAEPVIRVGNLEARRDFTDVRDIVRAYWLALDEGKGVAGEAYNLCSGIPYKLQDLLDQLLEMARRPLRIEFDPARARPSDVPLIYGDNTKFRQATGWEPLIPLSQSLHDLLDFWRQQVLEQDKTR